MKSIIEGLKKASEAIAVNQARLYRDFGSINQGGQVDYRLKIAIKTVDDVIRDLTRYSTDHDES